MPWTHCGNDAIADDATCPACGLTKAGWTIHFDLTRTFTISSSKKLKKVVKLVLSDGEGGYPAGERYRVELPDGTSVDGELNRAGYAKVDSKEAGPAVISFPDRAPGAVTTATEGVEEAAPGRFVSPVGGAKVEFTLRAVQAWIELEARDADGAPLAGEPYELRLGDGTVRTGVLDEQGLARVEGVPSGDSAVRFGERARDARTPPAPWLELELLDAEGHPLAGEPYRLKTDAGEVRTGTLDAQGRARIEGLAADAAYEVSFPGREALLWAR